MIRPLQGGADPLLQYARLIDLIDFSKTTFNLAISVEKKLFKSTIKYKEGIQVIKLGMIADIKGGNGFPKKYQGNTNTNDIPYYKVSDMNSEGNEIYMDKSNNYVEESLLRRQLKATVFPVHTIIFPKVGMAIYTNKKRILSRPSAIDNNTMGIICKSEYDYAFLYYYFITFVDLSSVSSKANPPSISAENLAQLKIPFPPKVVQQKIVTECQKIDTLVREAKKRIAELQEEIEKMVSNVKGKKTVLGDIYKISSGGTPSRKISAYWINGDIPWVTTTEVTNAKITSTNECITKTGLENSSARIYPKGSLIIAMYGQGSTRGRTAKLGIEACTNQACAVLYEKKIEVETDFVWYYLQSQYEKLRSISHGSVRPNLNANDIINYEIQLPSLTEQKTIVAKIGAIEDEIASLKKICDEAPARKKAILHRELIKND